MFEKMDGEAADIAVVEAELVTLAGHLAAGTCRFLQLLAEFDARRGWAGPGLRSCAHWLSWRVGLNLRTARDHLRVSHALLALPATTAAFAAGRVSYSKVRALTRIATPGTEAQLLSVALHGTTSQLEDLVAAARASRDPRPAQARRGLHHSTLADGSLLVRLRIPAERGAAFLAAIEAHLADLDRAGSDRAGSHSDADAGPPAARPVGSVSVADAVGPGSLAERAGVGSMRAVGSAAPAGVDPHSPAGAAQVHRQARAADEAIRNRAEEHAPGPVIDPVAAQRLDALLDLVTGDLTGTDLHRPTTLVVHVRTDVGSAAIPPVAAAPSSVLDAVAGRPAAWIEGGPPIAVGTAARLTCAAAVQALLVDRRGDPLYLGRTRRTVTRRQLRALRVRDRGRCVFPGCITTRHLEAHHLHWWRHGGRTDLDNLALVCTFHHTLIHDHGYRLQPAATAVPGGLRAGGARGPGGFTATRPDGSPVPAVPPPTGGHTDDLVAAHAVANDGAVPIDDWTITPDWGGERLDLDHALTWLLPELDRAAAAA